LETGRPVGTEALLRWDHATRGPISPTEFIPLAERSGLIVPIGAWVVEQALAQVAAWRAAASPAGGLWVAVNLSARQIDAPDLVATVGDALARAGVDASQLHLEVTETSLLGDVGPFVDQLDGLKSLGVHLGVDDFGTGYSSLSYLKRLPIDTLKIDRSFTDGLGTDPSDRSIVDAILGLGRALDLHVVAEGVENDVQLAELRELGCGYAQGFHWTRPLPADDLECWLALHAER
jgi:EAL domain-containing protein (putative c-di-GMP-specific phosphodiesterase class I)